MSQWANGSTEGSLSKSSVIKGDGEKSMSSGDIYQQYRWHSIHSKVGHVGGERENPGTERQVFLFLPYEQLFSVGGSEIQFKIF